MNNGRIEGTFLWIIENYAYVCQDNGKCLRSPKFTFNGLEDITWDLILFPNGVHDACIGNVSLFICGNKKMTVPENIMIESELSLLAEDGSVFHCRNSKYIFEDSESYFLGFEQFLQRDEIHLRRKEGYLPNDTLRVLCKIWTGEGDIQNAERISARTRIQTEQLTFFFHVVSYSTLQPNAKRTIQRFTPFYGEKLTFNLYYTDDRCNEDRMIIEIVPANARGILHKCKFSFLDKDRMMKVCGEFNYNFEAERRDIHKFPLSLPKDFVFGKKCEYLENDTFNLLCECTFSTKLYFHAIEEPLHEVPLKINTEDSNKAEVKKNKCAVKIFEHCSISEDMKAIYKSKHLTDVSLKTRTKSFPAHKIVLCVRSPVFEAMLTSEMKENITATIQIDELEDDTVEQLLLFLYSDSIETLQWGSATQLYYAADKYQIGKLKTMCSSFLVENLTISNASELLLLCDTHNDSNLIKIVEDFILKHEEQVYCSNGWKKLKEINPQLVIKTMCSKYERKNEVS